MSHEPRAPRAVEERRALGRRIRAYRLALDLGVRDIADHIGCGRYQVQSIETVCRDVLVGTLIDVAGAVGLEVGLVAPHHVPLLDLTADEIRALVIAAAQWSDHDGGGEDHLLAALDKLTTTEETP